MYKNLTVIPKQLLQSTVYWQPLFKVSQKVYVQQIISVDWTELCSQGRGGREEVVVNLRGHGGEPFGEDVKEAGHSKPTQEHVQGQRRPRDTDRCEMATESSEGVWEKLIKAKHRSGNRTEAGLDRSEPEAQSGRHAQGQHSPAFPEDPHCTEAPRINMFDTSTRKTIKSKTENTSAEWRLAH